jgi:hypothetical protein
MMNQLFQHLELNSEIGKPLREVVSLIIRSSNANGELRTCLDPRLSLLIDLVLKLSNGFIDVDIEALDSGSKLAESHGVRLDDVLQTLKPCQD